MGVRGVAGAGRFPHDIDESTIGDVAPRLRPLPRGGVELALVVGF